MGDVSTIDLDIEKSVFQIHGIDADGAVVIRKRISRAKLLEFFATLPPCLVGIGGGFGSAIIDHCNGLSSPIMVGMNSDTVG
jgi:hypothetical protein